MEIKIENYLGAQAALPNKGRPILGHQTDEEIVVYQAYKPSIADFAVRHQFLLAIEEITDFVKQQKKAFGRP